MTMKSRIAELYMTMALAGVFMNDGYAQKDTGKSLIDYTEEDKKVMMERIASERKRLLLKKGIKEFEYDGVTIFALNQKNADRKYRNFLKTINYENSKNI
jgi:hypothetical protein